MMGQEAWLVCPGVLCCPPEPRGGRQQDSKEKLPHGSRRHIDISGHITDAFYN